MAFLKEAQFFLIPSMDYLSETPSKTGRGAAADRGTFSRRGSEVPSLVSLSDKLLTLPCRSQGKSVESFLGTFLIILSVRIRRANLRLVITHVETCQ